MSLYKDCLRSAEKKQPEAKNYVRRQFKEKSKDVPRTDTMMIENLLRQGRRRLQMFNDPNVRPLFSILKFIYLLYITTYPSTFKPSTKVVDIVHQILAKY